MMSFDFKNPITSDPSLMLDDVAWGWEQPQEAAVLDQVAAVPEPAPVDFAMQNGQEPEAQDVDQQILQLDETTAPNFVIKKDEEPRGRPEGSKKRTQSPENQQHTTKRTRRSVKGHFDMPPGWIVEERVREKGRTAGQIDKTYIEPGTGRRFRSRPEVEAHLESLKEEQKIQEENEPRMGQPARSLYME